MWQIILVIASVLACNALVHSPPKIIEQPNDGDNLEILVYIGDTTYHPVVYIKCEAEGEPAPKYRWTKNGEDLNITANGGRITQKPSGGTLRLTMPRDEDLGQYQCFAENEHGIATSNSVFVRNFEFKYLIENKRYVKLEAEEGSPFHLKCDLDGYPKPKINWSKSFTGGSLEYMDSSRITIDPEGTLWFSNITIDDTFEDSFMQFAYICNTYSEFLSEAKFGTQFFLKVIPRSNASQKLYPPTRQYVSRPNEVALRGQTFEIFCIYGGTPLPQTVWSKDGQPIAWDDRITRENYGKSVVIREISIDDEGSYTCDVSNGVGQQSSTINLEIKATPYFIKEPESQNATEGQTVTFECEAKGIPEAAIKWIHNGKPIEQAPQNPRRTVMENKIIIRDLVKSDSGNYGCNATNAFGYVYKDVYVNIINPDDHANKKTTKKPNTACLKTQKSVKICFL